jgi:hypothetical protein
VRIFTFLLVQLLVPCLLPNCPNCVAKSGRKLFHNTAHVDTFQKNNHNKNKYGAHATCRVNLARLRKRAQRCAKRGRGTQLLEPEPEKNYEKHTEK